MAVKEPRGSKSERYCMDRAIGHDWDNFKWKDGPDVKQGRRTLYVHFRDARCTRCGSTRREVFDQVGGELVKRLKGGNRYLYSKVFKERTRMTQGELRAELHREEVAA